VLITSGTDLPPGVDPAQDTVVVTVSGELDAITAQDLHNHLDHLATDQDALVLDLTGVTFCDSVGLASVLELLHLGADVRVVCSRQVVKTIALTGSGQEFPFFGSVRDAIGGHGCHSAHLREFASSH
jgi:anti-sigma B factor antagonist